MNRRWYSVVAGVAAVAAMAGTAFANAPMKATVKTVVAPVKTIALRDMRNLNLPPVMRQIMGNHHYTELQIARLREKLIHAGYLKPATGPFLVPLKTLTPVGAHSPRAINPTIQSVMGQGQSVTAGLAFPGLGVSDTPPDTIGCAPPDTNSAVGHDTAIGADAVVEIVNTCGGTGVGQFKVWNASTGAVVQGTTSLGDLWSTSDCINGGGDNQASYDQFAHRWLLSQFNSSYTGICLAVSATDDPTGSYYLYNIVMDPSGFTDYPKMGKWVTGDDNSDSYFVSANDFPPAACGNCTVFTAVQRSAVLAGNPAGVLTVIGAPYTSGLDFNDLPADVDGSTMPPLGDPGIFVNYISPWYYGGTTYALEMWQMSVDWGAMNASLTGPTEIDVDPFNDGDNSCAPQPSGGECLPTLGDRLMFRLAYRNGYTGSSDQYLVVNHAVTTNGTSAPIGIDWYQLSAPSGSVAASDWSIAQQGIYAPADDQSRFMGSIAMDHNGNIGLGYTVSGPSAGEYPSVAVSGQNVGGPSGTMDVPEQVLIQGAGVQTSTGRWGDYSSIMASSTDDCTFWTAQEYISETGSFHWSTGNGSFKFQNCSIGPTGTVSGTVTDANTGNPIAGAQVTLSPGNETGTSGNDGTYSITTAPGDYTAVACAFAYICSDPAAVTIVQDQTTTQNFSLQPAATAVLQGHVVDQGHGYPLYAHVVIKADGITRCDMWTDVTSGHYKCASLPTGTTYTATVTPYFSGYTAGSATGTLTGDTTKNFSLSPDASCTAPGYQYTGGVSQDFDGGTFPPDGWTVTNDVSGSIVAWIPSSQEPIDNGNYTGGTGDAADADSNDAGPGVGSYDTSLITPPIDVSSLSGTTLQWLESYILFSGNEALDVDISTDGGTTWTNVQHQTSNCGTLYATGCSEALDLSGVLPPSGTFQLRWRYYNLVSDYDWYAQVDNVLLGAQCTAIAGGLVVGTAHDANTGNQMLGVSVTDENGNSTQTTATAGGASGYVMFESSGSHTLTASKNNYQDNVKSVNVSNGQIKNTPFVMRAGVLQSNPTSYTANIPAGTMRTLPLFIKDTGTGPADWQLSSIDAPPAQPFHGGGAPKQNEHCTGRVSPASVLYPSKSQCSGGDSNAPGRNQSNDPTWTAIADYPIPVLDSCMAKDENGTGLIYSVTGVSGGSNTASDYVYDPGTDSWSSFADFPNGGLEKPACAFIGGKLYVADGWDGSGNNSAALNIYDPSTDSWSTGADTPYSTGGGAVAVALNDKLYVIGGCQNGSSCPGDSSVEVYDPSTDSWSAAADYPAVIAWQSCGAIAGEIYCAGGIASGSETPDTYVYDPGTDTWTGGLAPIPVATGGLWGSAFTSTSDGQFLVQDGVTDNFATITNEGFAYDVASDTWSPLPNNTVTTYRPGSSCGFYQVGGQDGSFTGIQDAVNLPGFDVCSVGPVPWLAFSQSSGTLTPYQTAHVVVTFDGTGQTPGTTSVVQIKLSGNTPYGGITIPVTVNWQ